MINENVYNLKNKYESFTLQNTKKPYAERQYEEKLENKDFSTFKDMDWIYYFKEKYLETNEMEYIIAGKRTLTREKSIYRTLIREFPDKDIKLMIDFMFDSQQDMIPKDQIGGFVFSEKWIDGVYQNAKLWQIGKYKSKAELNKVVKPKLNREWKDNSEDNEESIEF